ncbi:MAG: hypothetical protein QUV20_12525 [Oceanibaculum nanhaiense]|uniref:hypothetical protein n=1 Tax=Oceanibaculum nanhaiense TaxID=1909734 RepID=UPI0025A41FFA|nr:hypothetical protein [Oceanibaculum nanhaiense]MDM7947148.1 hypothetical protein [Oceanibaculum nanhaiense]
MEIQPLLAAPSSRLWAERQAWFQRRLDDSRGEMPTVIGEQAEALLIDLQLAFCAGAWGAVVILAQTVLDADLADRELAGEEMGIALNDIRFGRDYVWLRNRRNDLVHEEGRTALTMHDQTQHRQRLEVEARRAVELLFKALKG